MSALAVILVLMGWYLPFIGILISFVAPLPFLVVTSKYGLRYGAITVFVSAVISYFFTGDPLIIVSVVLSLGSIGLALGYAMAKRWSAERMLMLGAGVFVVVTAVIIYGTKVLLGQDLIKQMAETLRQSAEMLRSSPLFSDYVGTGTSTTATPSSPAGQVLQSYEDYAKTLESGLMTPSLIALSSFALSFYNYVIIKPFAKRLGLEMPNLPAMQNIKLPALGVWLLPIALALMVVKVPFSAYLGLNVYLVAVYYLVFDGLFYLARILIGDKDNRFLKVLLIVGLFFPYMPQVYFLFGIYDCFVRIIKREG